jgi:PEP-CTERM/exosortase A-associated glycosyltransferase
MKILHVFDHSIPYFSGYTFRSGYILANQRKMGFEPMVLTSLKHQKQEAQKEILDGQVYYRTPALRNPLARSAFTAPLLGEGVHMMRLFKRILEVHREEPFDLIHAHSPALNGFPALRAGRRLKVPVVYEIRAFWEDAGVDLGTYSGEGSMKYKSVRRFETYLCRKAHAVTTICDGLKNDLLGRGILEEKITVIPNGVEEGLFLPRPRDEQLMEQLGLEAGKVVGFIGSFYDYEGLDLLIQGFALIRERAKDIKLLLVGGGYQGQDEKLKALAADLDLGKSCIFTGRVPHDEVKKYYSVIDYLVYPRRSMRLTELVTPLKPLEAMSMEKTVFGSSVGGIAELVKDGVNGYLFKPDDAESLAETFLRVSGNVKDLEELGPRSRRFVQEHRNWEKIVARYKDVYRSALERFRGEAP